MCVCVCVCVKGAGAGKRGELGKLLNQGVHGHTGLIFLHSMDVRAGSLFPLLMKRYMTQPMVGDLNKALMQVLLFATKIVCMCDFQSCLSSSGAPVEEPGRRLARYAWLKPKLYPTKCG